MTLTLNSDHLRAAASLFRRLKGKSTLPILNYVLFTVTAGEQDAVMEVTDLDVHLAYRVPFGGPTTPGRFLLPKSDFFHIAKTADKATAVRFDVFAAEARSPRVMVILYGKSMRSNLEILSLPPKEFPPGPDMAAAEPPVMMPAATLAAIRRVGPCASDDETRYVLNGVFITRHLAGAVVATDGRRMAMQAAAVATADAILPRSVVNLLDDAACLSAAMLRRRPAYHPPEDEPMAVHLDDLASLKFSRATITFKIIDGNYPNYLQVIPSVSDIKGSCTFPPNSLAPITGWLRQYGPETVALQFAADVVTFEVRRPDKGTFTTQALAMLTGFPPAQAAYNASFLADALAMGLHTMDLIDECSPAVLTDGLVRFVLMPMRVMGPAAPEPEAAAEGPVDPSESEESEDPEPQDEPAVANP